MRQSTALAQLLKLFPRREFTALADQYHVGQRFRKTSRWNQFVTMLIAQLTGQESLRDIETAGRTRFRQLALFGLQPMARATLARVNAKQPWELYRDCFYRLLHKCQQFRGHRKLPIDRRLLSIDSSTILLCMSLFAWAHYRFKKGAVKLHVCLDHESLLPDFVWIKEGCHHDHTFLKEIPLDSEAAYTFDRGYYDFDWYQRLTDEGCAFVTRSKAKLLHKVVKECPVPKGSNVRHDQWIRLSGACGKKYKGLLRRVVYHDPETGKELFFISNQFEWSAETIAAVYKERWQIELFFKWIKQHLRVKSFVGTSINALMTQLYIALIAYLMMAFLKLSLKLEESMLKILRVVRVALFDNRCLLDLLRAPPPSNTKPASNQLQLGIT